MSLHEQCGGIRNITASNSRLPNHYFVSVMISERPGERFCDSPDKVMNLSCRLAPVNEAVSGSSSSEFRSLRLILRCTFSITRENIIEASFEQSSSRRNNLRENIVSCLVRPNVNSFLTYDVARVSPRSHVMEGYASFRLTVKDSPVHTSPSSVFRQ